MLIRNANVYIAVILQKYTLIIIFRQFTNTFIADF